MDKKYIFGFGFFDSVHIGHQNLIGRVLKIAKESDLEPSIITFDDDFYILLNNSDKNIYLSSERNLLFNYYGINKIVTLKSSSTLNLTAKEFFENLLKNYKIEQIVVGADFRLGKDQRDINFLKEFCVSNDIRLNIVSLLNINGEKISTSTLRKHIKNGDVKMASILLGRYFSVTGVVVPGRQEGRNNKLNTANIFVEEKKIIPKDGVYATISEINGQFYRSITHVGAIPTYNIDKLVIETHIFDFNSNIYNENLKLYFIDRIRDIKTFSQKEDLYKQIEIDSKQAKRIKINKKLIV